MWRMKATRTSKPVARSTGRKVAAKAAAKRAAAKKGSAKAGSEVKFRKGAGPSGTARASASARAELASLLDSIHRNLDDTEALLAE